MVGLIIVSVIFLGGLVYLGFAIKNAPVLDEPDESTNIWSFEHMHSGAKTTHL